jgi:predicted unusual protein kinase regulating ubiquinone biosynthesis (AarF/ABC1/UbiB family)
MAGVKRNQVWRQDYVEIRRRVLSEEIARSVAAAGAHDTIDAIHRRIRRVARDPSVEGQLDAVLLTIEILAIDGAANTLSTRDIHQLHATAARILEKHAVNPRSSRLSRLFGELEANAASLAAQRSQRWTAAWASRIAREEAGVEIERELFSVVELELMLGHREEAVRLLIAAELACRSSSRPMLRLAHAKVLRLSGDRSGARRIVDALLTEEAGDPEVRWEAAVLDTVECHDLEPQVKLTRLRKEDRRPDRLLDLFLWAHATRKKAWLDVVPRASSLHRTDGRVLDQATLQCAEAIERCYHARASPVARLNALGRALEHVDRVTHPERRMLIWAAAARWLLRVKRRSTAELCAAQYRALSIALTKGASDDVMGLALLDGANDRSPPTEVEENGDRLPPQRWARLSAMSKLGAELVWTYARNALVDFVGRLNPNLEYVARDTSEIIATYMDELKGPFMKLGQIVGFYGFDLPEEVRTILCSLQDRSTALPAAVIRTTIAAELGKPVESIFDEFDDVPLGTGSLGQVHRAVLSDGLEVAVKVQYPDAVHMARTDLAILRAISPPMQLLVPSWNVEAILSELARRLDEECDYETEAEHQRFFRDALNARTDVVIPRVILELSTKRVLTSELIRGERFESFRITSTAAERTRAAETIFSVWVETAIMRRSFNSDAQPGNLLFLDGSVAFVDFGSCVHWKAGEGNGFLEVLLALYGDDVDRLRAAMIDLGIAPPTPDFDFGWATERMTGGILGALREDRAVRIRFEDVRRELLHFFDRNPSSRLLSIPPRYALGMRAYWGMLSTLARLDVDVNLRRVARETIGAARIHAACGS